MDDRYQTCYEIVVTVTKTKMWYLGEWLHSEGFKILRQLQETPKKIKPCPSLHEKQKKKK